MEFWMATDLWFYESYLLTSLIYMSGIIWLINHHWPNPASPFPRKKMECVRPPLLVAKTLFHHQVRFCGWTGLDLALHASSIFSAPASPPKTDRDGWAQAGAWPSLSTHSLTLGIFPSASILLPPLSCRPVLVPLQFLRPLLIFKSSFLQPPQWSRKTNVVPLTSAAYSSVLFCQPGSPTEFKKTMQVFGK